MGLSGPTRSTSPGHPIELCREDGSIGQAAFNCPLLPIGMILIIIIRSMTQSLLCQKRERGRETRSWQS
ncbi:hypothetical protein BDQ94DRAFT_142852 [Aspergillus welwitschiae]|uniref:Uncharacterized protein n=1 Tax=Aspergillus welwitschiae TaxID=1341132 RepID=A0A3F3Q439_9EURO|nr:hypothetical protein BDQ94DRAFT_142852 [Aspergillus welwitschiae]RDH33891.1 hypothetical protein BDQ94DRAFT_142852 [Aspergillus welwitschiae]